MLAVIFQFLIFDLELEQGKAKLNGLDGVASARKGAIRSPSEGISCIGKPSHSALAIMVDSENC